MDWALEIQSSSFGPYDLHAIMHVAFPVKTFGKSVLPQDVHCRLFQDPRPDSRLDVVSALPLENDAVDPAF